MVSQVGLALEQLPGRRSAERFCERLARIRSGLLEREAHCGRLDVADERSSVSTTVGQLVEVRRVHAIDAMAAGAPVVEPERQRWDGPYGVAWAAGERRTEARRLERR